MSSIASFAIRRTAQASRKNIFEQARFLTGTGDVPIDVDHYVSGWEEAGDFGQTGKYQIQTFNKISDKVSQQCMWIL